MDKVLFDRLVASLEQANQIEALASYGFTIDDAIQIARKAGYRLRVTLVDPAKLAELRSARENCGAPDSASD